MVSINQKGQAVFEYIVLLGVVVSLGVGLLQLLGRGQLQDKMLSPFKQDFARIYQYGNKKTKGFDEDGGPEHHPRAVGGSNFRIFLNPGAR